jgi:hypothetical protein
MKKLVGIILPIVVALVAAIMPVVPAKGDAVSPTLFSGNFDTQWNNPIQPPEGTSDGLEPGGIWKIVPNPSGTPNDYVMMGQSSDIYHRGTAIFAGETSWSSYSYEAKILTTDQYWGLIFYADSTGKTFYSVYLNATWGVEIFRHFNGIWGRVGLVGTPLSPTPERNTWYNVKVSVANVGGGTEIKLWYAPEGVSYPNDPQLIYLDSGPGYYTAGRIGFMFYDDHTPVGNYACYDNVVVTGASCSLFSDSFDGYLAKWHKLGSTIPLKWQYTDSGGNVVDSANANPVIGWTFTGAVPASGILGEEDAPGASGLRYDALTMTWQFNWKTKGLSEGVYNITITSNQPVSSGPIPIGLRK